MNMQNNFVWNKFLLWCGWQIIIAVCLASCNGGNSGTASTANVNQLQQYINTLFYVPDKSVVSIQSARQEITKSALTHIGNQVSFVSGGLHTLKSIDYIWYSDSGCITPVLALSLIGPAAIHAGTYTTSDQSLLALCGNYTGDSSGNCSQLLLDAQGGKSNAIYI